MHVFLLQCIIYLVLQPDEADVTLKGGFEEVLPLTPVQTESWFLSSLQNWMKMWTWESSKLSCYFLKEVVGEP